jgi:hypothetical protein
LCGVWTRQVIQFRSILIARLLLRSGYFGLEPGRPSGLLSANGIVIVKLIRPERLGRTREYRNLVLESLEQGRASPSPVARHHSQLIAQLFHRHQLSYANASEESTIKVNELERIPITLRRMPAGGEVRSGTLAVHS